MKSSGPGPYARSSMPRRGLSEPVALSPTSPSRGCGHTCQSVRGEAGTSWCKAPGLTRSASGPGPTAPFGNSGSAEDDHRAVCRTSPALAQSLHFTYKFAPTHTGRGAFEQTSIGHARMHPTGTRPNRPSAPGGESVVGACQHGHECAGHEGSVSGPLGNTSARAYPSN